MLSKPPKQSGAEIQERPDKKDKTNRELWQESVANSSLELSEILDSLLSVIRKDDEQIQFLEKNGAGRKELVSCIVDLLTCNTVDREGNPIPDNMARAKGAELLSSLHKMNTSDAQKLGGIRLLLETLGIKNGSGVNVNFNFTKQLYGDS